jgi:hypothetical protein
MSLGEAINIRESEPPCNVKAASVKDFREYPAGFGGAEEVDSFPLSVLFLAAKTSAPSSTNSKPLAGICRLNSTSEWIHKTSTPNAAPSATGG